MYTGHVAIALAARGTHRDLPLWVLVASAQACDWVEILFDSSAGRVRSELWSHAYPFVLIAAGVAAVLVGIWKRSPRAALLVLAVYLSHPFADLVTGYKPLWAGGPPLGLRFIDRAVADFVVQSFFCIVGWAIYSRSLRLGAARRMLIVAPLVALIMLQSVSDLVVYVRRPFRAKVAQIGP